MPTSSSPDCTAMWELDVDVIAHCSLPPRHPGHHRGSTTGLAYPHDPDQSSYTADAEITWP